MQGLAIVLAAASLGVDYGWQTTDDGALEYIIQIEPELLIALQKGEAIVSEIHPDAAGVRRFRIQIGSQPLPRVGKSSHPDTETPTDPRSAADPLTPEPSSPAKTPLPDNNTVESTLPPPDKTFVEDDPAPPFAPLKPSQPDSSDFPLPDNTPPAGNSSPLPEAELPPSDFPIGETDFPATPAREAPVAIPSAPLPLPTDHLTPPKATPVRQKLVPVPDPDRQPLDPIPSESSFPSRPLPTNNSLQNEADNSATAIPTFGGTQLATFNKTGEKPAVKAAAPRTIASNPSPSADIPQRRPWLLLSVTILGLLGSLGANAYLVYLFLGIQRRYQGLRQQQRLTANELS